MIFSCGTVNYGKNPQKVPLYPTVIIRKSALFRMRKNAALLYAGRLFFAGISGLSIVKLAQPNSKKVLGHFSPYTPKPVPRRVSQRSKTKLVPVT